MRKAVGHVGLFKVLFLQALELELERGRAEAHQLRRQLAEAKTTDAWSSVGPPVVGEGVLPVTSRSTGRWRK